MSQFHSIEFTTFGLLQDIATKYNHDLDSIDPDNIAEFIESRDCPDDDVTIDFDGNEYRIIKDSEIWGIYVETIKEIVNDCYDLKLDKLPDFLAVNIDWEQTAKNCYVDGYGHTFASYDGDDLESGEYWVFRVN